MGMNGLVMMVFPWLVTRGKGQTMGVSRVFIHDLFESGHVWSSAAADKPEVPCRAGLLSSAEGALAGKRVHKTPFRGHVFPICPRHGHVFLDGTMNAALTQHGYSPPPFSSRQVHGAIITAVSSLSAWLSSSSMPACESSAWSVALRSLVYPTRLRSVRPWAGFLPGRREVC